VSISVEFDGTYNLRNLQTVHLPLAAAVAKCYTNWRHLCNYVNYYHSRPPWYQNNSYSL